MSIRLLAIELYKAIKQVQELQNKLQDATLTAAQRQHLENQLRTMTAERDRIKSILEGAKAS